MAKSTGHRRRSLLSRSVALRALALVGTGLSTLVVAPCPAVAQDYTTGSIQGVVRTPDGATVVGGEATIQSNSQGFTRTVEVDDSGTFRVSSLPIGAYTITVSAPGHQTVSDNGITVEAGASATYTFTLPVAAAGSEDIVVVARAVRGSDFASNQTGVNLDVQTLLETVPISRDATALALLAPGAVQGDSGFPNLASIGGGTVGENSYYVNGLNITNFRNFVGASTVPFEFYRTLDVKTGGYQAEFGRALGGFTSAVTKSGSNDVKAGAVIIYNPDALRANAPNTEAAFNQGDFAESVIGNFYLSGPVIRDRLFVYALYNPRYIRSQYSSFTGQNTTQEKSNSPFFAAKVDAVITDGHRLEFTYFRNKETFTYDYSDFNPNSKQTGAYYGTLDITSGGDNYIGTYIGAFTDWFTLSASYGKYRDDYQQITSPETAYVTSRLALNANGQLISGVQRRASGSVLARMDRVNERTIYRADADIRANLFGEHHFRVGYDREDLNATEDLRRNGGYNYDLRPNFIFRAYYANIGEFTGRNEAVYAEDAWSIADGRLNLQLGVRGDRFIARTLEGANYYDGKFRFAPRIGGSFDVFGDRSTKINAFFGRYYLPLAVNTSVRLTGREVFYQQRFRYPTGVNPAVFGANGIPVGLAFDAQGNPAIGAPWPADTLTCPANSPDAGKPCFTINSDGEIPPPDRFISSTLKPSYNDEFIIGASRRFNNWTVTLNYIRRRLGDTLEDQAIDAAVIRYCQRNNIAGCAAVFTGYKQLVVSNPGESITVVPNTTIPELANKPLTLSAEELGHTRAQRNYDSIQFEVDKAFNGRWGFNASYVYTSLRGNFEGSARSDNNQREAGYTNDFDQPGYEEGAYGVLANQRAHVFKVRGSIKPAPWLLLGANALLASPRKFSCIGNYRDPNDFAAAYGASTYYCSNVRATGLPLLVPDPASPGYDGITTAPALISRGTAFQSDWQKRIDVGIQFNLAALPGTNFRVDVFNVFNWRDRLDFNEFGDIGFGGASPSYGQVTGYTAPRSVRFTLAMRFGEKGR